MAEIYKIEDQIYHKIYIGQTTQGVKTRYLQHLERAKNPKDVTKLHCAMRTLGPENFWCETIEECPEAQLDEREKFWIKHYDSYVNGYNMTSGGNGGSIYIIDDIKVRKMWDEGLSLRQIAKEFECSVNAISSRLSNYSNYSKEESHLRSTAKPVYQYDLAGVFWGRYPSASAAEVAINGPEARNRDNIGACARGEQRIAYGYYWSYEKLERGPILYTTKGISCPIVQYTKNKEWVATYVNLAEAERAMIAQGHKRPHISEVCQKRPSYKTSCGYIWRYIYDEEINQPIKSETARLADKLN